MSLQRIFADPKFPPRLLLVDALATGATALLLLAAADLLAPLLQLPAGLQRTAGLICVPFVLWLLALSRRPTVPRGAMAAVVAINLAWVAGSAWVAFGGTWQPSPLGIAFVSAQALVVLVFAELGWFGLRATRPAPPVPA
ncbi:hypothetical protein H0E84_12190 [Luteimonas sp. SJ-92]|uniref:Uncharacterized protein n=1 Tax=Luteimonas salinisoli TaxID=2752307 RepID=A0A853JF14_9GAMM|nr:hypothetical protein [Luteimonas salinisoli]NZA27140.1 hypothetical protein [Luteimonas salinisoli]